MTTYHPDSTTTATPAGSRPSDTGSSSESWTENAKVRLDTHRAQAMEAAETAQLHAQDMAQRGSDETARFVRENPALAMAGAVGIGILLGLALRDRF